MSLDKRKPYKIVIYCSSGTSLTTNDTMTKQELIAHKEMLLQQVSNGGVAAYGDTIVNFSKVSLITIHEINTDIKWGKIAKYTAYALLAAYLIFILVTWIQLKF